MIAPDIPTDRLVLSILTPADASERYRGWMADPEVFRYLESRDPQVTLSSIESYIGAMTASPDSYQFGIFTTGRAEHIGNIKLGPVSTEHSTASIGLLVGDRAWWGKGVATEAIGALTNWGFGSLGLERLFAGAYAQNVPSIRAFERVGYRVEGVRRSAVRLLDGTRDDVVELGRLRDDPDPA